MYFRRQVCYGSYCSEVQGDVSPILHETILQPDEYIYQVDFQSGSIVDGLNVFHTDVGNSYTAAPITAAGIDGIANAGARLAYFSGRIGSHDGAARMTWLKYHFTEC